MEQEVMKMVAAKLKSLSAPVRLNIVQMLMERPHTVTELVEKTNEKQSNISKHLKILAQAKVVEFDRDNAFRIYKLADKRVMDVCKMVCAGLAEELSAEVDKSKMFKQFLKEQKKG